MFEIVYMMKDIQPPVLKSRLIVEYQKRSSEDSTHYLYILTPARMLLWDTTLGPQGVKLSAVGV